MEESKNLELPSSSTQDRSSERGASSSENDGDGTENDNSLYRVLHVMGLSRCTKNCMPHMDGKNRMECQASGTVFIAVYDV